MGKLKKQKARQKKLEKHKMLADAQKRKISRRNFLIGAGSLAGLVAGGIATKSLQDPDYSEWYHQNFSYPVQDPQVHPDLVERCTPDQELLNLTDEKFLGSLNPQSIIKVHKREFYQGVVFSPMSQGGNTIKSYIKNARMSVADFFSFIGEKGVPNMEIIPLTPKTQLTESSDNRLIMHLTHRLYETDLLVKYNLEIDGRKVVGVGSKNKSTLGEFYNSMGMHFLKERDPPFVLTKNKTSPIIVSLGKDPVEAYTSPPAESLHHRLKDYRVKRTLDKITSDWKEMGSPDSIEEQFLFDVSNELMSKEEGLVHGLLDHFLETKGNKIGLDKKDILNYQKHGADPERYVLIPKVRSAIDVYGPKKVLDIYKNNPEKLFN